MKISITASSFLRVKMASGLQSPLSLCRFQAASPRHRLFFATGSWQDGTPLHLRMHISRVQVPRSRCPEGCPLTTQTHRQARDRRPSLGGPTLGTTPPPPAACPPGWLGHHSLCLPCGSSPTMRLSTRWQRRLPDVVSLPSSPASTPCPLRTRSQDAGVTSPMSVAASSVLSA